MSTPATPTVTHWVTKDGHVIAVTEMTDDHLANTIRFLWRTAEAVRDHEAYEMDSAAQNMRGEMASNELEAAAWALYDLPIQDYLESTMPTWPTLIAEATRRGIMPALDGYEDA